MERFSRKATGPYPAALQDTAANRVLQARCHDSLSIRISDFDELSKRPIFN
jgi:hypothetical protein